MGLALKKPPHPLLKQQDHIQENQRAINQRPWMKHCCLWGERKVSLFHTPNRGPHQFPLPLQPKKNNGAMKKKRRPTAGARKSKQMKQAESYKVKLKKY